MSRERADVTIIIYKKNVGEEINVLYSNRISYYTVVMLKSTCPKHDVHTLQAEKGSADISWGYSDPYGESVLPFLLFRIGLTISVPVLSISHAKLCIRQRKALHPPTQSFASAHAKLCIRSRKRLLEKAPI